MNVTLLPMRQDNYAYALHQPGANGIAVVDPSDAPGLITALDFLGLNLDLVLNTHHHGDHTGGNEELKARFGCPVVGPAYDEGRVPGMTRGVREGDEVLAAGARAKVLHVPGHTTGAVAFYFAELGIVFTGDTLFALGCGRMFEGTPPVMWDSLCKLAALPPQTLVYCGHEYTEANARFALAAEPDNEALKSRAAEVKALRAAGRPTVPSTIGSERLCNPFLRAGGAERFAQLRQWKDQF